MLFRRLRSVLQIFKKNESCFDLPLGVVAAMLPSETVEQAASPTVITCIEADSRIEVTGTDDSPWGGSCPDPELPATPLDKKI